VQCQVSGLELEPRLRMLIRRILFSGRFPFGNKAATQTEGLIKESLETKLKDLIAKGRKGVDNNMETTVGDKIGIVVLGRGKILFGAFGLVGFGALIGAGTTYFLMYRHKIADQF
jgi:hypothetical protein